MLSSLLFSITYGESENQENSLHFTPVSTSSNMEKSVIIIFDRGYDTQFKNAKPILDKYGFKVSFFIICNFIDGNGYYKLENGKEELEDSFTPMNWDQIRLLSKEGHDIESHGMEHRYLLNLSSPRALEDEIGGSKQCLEDQGLKPTYFQIPFNRGADNSTILKMISEYYDFGLSGHSRLMFLNCDGWVNYGFKTRSYKYQEDCNPYSDEGIPTRTHKYAIREWSHDRFHTRINNNYTSLDPHGTEISNKLFAEFVSLVEAQNQYNIKLEKVVAVPVIGYHSIDNYTRYDTSPELFDREMQYLYENGFKVLKLTDLGYDEEEHHFYIK
ncbi:MAG: polysaccharide deacetylase family protein [Nitrososphaeraceae archaeon]|nr:polysaccharide deacetylase family protein [Nitrososphaeraceae archaeon]